MSPQVFLLFVLLGPQCGSPSACVLWPKEMHKQEFTVQEEKKFNIELANQRQRT